MYVHMRRDVYAHAYVYVTFRRAVEKPIQRRSVEEVAIAVKVRRPSFCMRVPPARFEMTPETAMKAKREETCIDECMHMGDGDEGEEREETCALVMAHCETAYMHMCMHVHMRMYVCMHMHMGTCALVMAHCETAKTCRTSPMKRGNSVRAAWVRVRVRVRGEGEG